MRPLAIAIPGGEAHAARLLERIDAEPADVVIRQFPDGEVYVRIDSPVADRDVVLIGGLDQPHAKILPLLFAAATARDLGARRIGLIAPYLSFMRQDARFHPGEGVTASYFAALVSRTVDWLATVDPHLHRLSSLDQIYRIPNRVARAAPAIAAWIRREIPRPVIIGPDAESEQWVAAVARGCEAPYLVLHKTRRGDRDVSVSAPDLDAHRDRTPVLVDDIISTGRTMIEATGQLVRAGAIAPVCVGIHAVFAESAYAELLAAGAARIVTCNTIAHLSNAIEVDDALAGAARSLLAEE